MSNAYQVLIAREELERGLPLLSAELDAEFTRETAEFLQWAVCENLIDVPLSRN